MYKLKTNLQHLELFLTESCNLNCDYCYAHNNENRDIPISLAKKAIDVLLINEENHRRKIKLTLWGGEPFLPYELLRQTVIYSKEQALKHAKELRIHVPTNLTLLDEKKMAFIKEHKIQLSLSLDGDAGSQGKRKILQGKSSFPLVMKKLDLIKKHFAPDLPVVRKTVSTENVKDMFHDVSFLHDQGFKNISLSPVFEDNWTDNSKQHYKMQLIKIADLWIDSLLHNSPIRLNSWEELLAINELHKNSQLLKPEFFFCQAGFSQLTVDIKGRIFPCHRFVFYDKENKNQCLGIIELSKKKNNDNSAYQLKLHENIMANYHKIKTENLTDKNDNCRSCSHNDKCIATCPAVNYRLANSIFSQPVSVCEFYFINIDILNYINEKIGRTAVYRQFLQDAVNRNGQYKQSHYQTQQLLNNLNQTAIDKATDRLNVLLNKGKNEKSGKNIL